MVGWGVGMSCAREVLAVLLHASEPLSNAAIRQHSSKDLDSQSVAQALNGLCAAGRTERIVNEGAAGTYFITDEGKAWLKKVKGDVDDAAAPQTPAARVIQAKPMKPAPPAVTVAAAPKPLAATVAATVSKMEVAPDRVPTGDTGEFSRRLMREAAMLLIDAAGDGPMTQRASRVIGQLIEVAA